MNMENSGKSLADIQLLPLLSDGQRFYVQLHEHISNGFPSPADDFEGRKISLDERYLAKPESTFIGRAAGMSNAPYILPDDFLIIRADLQPASNELGIFYIPGEGFTAKIFDFENKCLRPMNPAYPILDFNENNQTEARGVVKAVFRDIANLSKLGIPEIAAVAF